MSKSASFTKTLGAASIALMTLAGAASAEDREFAWSITLAGTSDYIFRGISTNGEDPAFQPAINASYGIFYAGAWGSNIVDPYGPWETDFYAGIKPTLGPVTFDLGAVYYAYFGSDDDLDYYELKAGASWSPFTNFSLTPVFWYTPDQDNYAETWTVEGTAAYTLPAVGIFTPTVSGLVGYTESTDVPAFFLGEDDYTYWNAGLALAVEKFTFDFRYWDTSITDGGAGLADERFVFTASVTLP
jgi:uncharacterized protein (TIGR02001 family)